MLLLRINCTNVAVLSAAAVHLFVYRAETLRLFPSRNLTEGSASRKQCMVSVVLQVDRRAVCRTAES